MAKTVKKAGKKAGKAPTGVSRIDQPHKHNHGFYVRLTRNGEKFSKFFSDKKCGGKAKAKAQAQAHYAELCEKFPRMTRRAFAQIVRRGNAEGTVGVSRIIKVVKGKTYRFWQATWSPKVGAVRKEAFSVQRYGDTRAFELALKARNKGVKEMAD
ncbi:MAG: hypothetical protein HC904_08465 [Blastochloris sp.]|nr:hypothetical protein [Blastochloris sp.]